MGNRFPQPFERMEENLMKAEELTFEVKAKMTVDKRTAEGCLHLVEMFVNDTGAKIIVDKDANGEMRFHYEFAE